MKKLIGLKQNAVGGVDAIFSGHPYTLTKDEVALAEAGQDDWGGISQLSVEDSVMIEQNKTRVAINQLEASISNRRFREASLGSVESTAFIQDIDDQITALRSSLI